MRSAETSGVGGEGFGVALAPRRTTTQQLRHRLLLLRRHVVTLTPTTLAVAITALSAAFIYICSDVARTVSDRGEELQLVNTISDNWQRLDPNAETVLPAGVPIAATLAPSEPMDDETLSGIWQRGAGALALALIAIGLVWRRRDDVRPGVPTADRRRLNEILESIPHGIACWSDDGALLNCNAEFDRRLQLGSAGKDAQVTYFASVTRLIEGGYMRLVAEHDDGRVLELHGADGSALSVHERPMPSGGFVTMVSDITERRKAELMLAAVQDEQRQLARRYHEEKLKAEAANHSKISFLAHLSHDIRTPLNHIIGFAELMRQKTYGPIGDSHYEGYVETIKGSGERLLSFFASILELAEFEAGQKSLRSDLLPADEVLASVVRRHRPQAVRAGIMLNQCLPTGAMISGDRFCLERMLANLVDNAIRFTPQGGRIDLNVYAADNGVVLEVADTGIGMSLERVAALSQPFAFGDAALTREHGGAGLGISIARAIAEQSGGRLAIDSRPGLGTTVEITLPVANAVPAALPSTASVAA